MRRLAAAVVLVGLVSGPGLHVWCELTCASDAVAGRLGAAESHCHDAPASTTSSAIQIDDACGTHAQPAVAVVSARSARLLLTPVGDSEARAVRITAASFGHARPRSRGASTSPPISPGTRVLRV